MKIVTKKLVGLILLGTLAVPLSASTTKQNIFPSYTGSMAEINGESISIRNYPSSYSEVMTTVGREHVYILGQNDDWYRVRTDGMEGWVSKDSLEVSENTFVPYSKVLGEEVVEYAKQFIGTPYVWGGNDLKKGVDCSGLTKKIFEGFDIYISRVSSMQVNDGKQISKSELRPGDLIFFDTNGTNTGHISHVGIYAGDGLFLHADCSRGVTLTSLSNSYYVKNYVTSSRIINEF